jgi:hypothetical protein
LLTSSGRVSIEILRTLNLDRSTFGVAKFLGDRSNVAHVNLVDKVRYLSTVLPTGTVFIDDFQREVQEI